MEALQEWFAPLLWILGTITALIAFIRLCKPVWNLLQSPKQLTETITALDDKLSKNFADIDARFAKIDASLQELKKFDELSDEVQINLLRDRLSQGYTYYKDKGELNQEAYRSLCDLYSVYEKCGGNSYAKTIMEQIHALFQKSK